MEVTDLSWDVNSIKRNNSKLLPKSIRGIINENQVVVKQRYY